MIHNTKELYDQMLATPDLCGKFELIGKTICWELFAGFAIEISIEPPATHFGIEKRLFKRFTVPITHWHPDEKDVFEEVCRIGLKGNVLVIRENLLVTSVIYMGKEENCPYLPKRKWAWGRITYLKAE